MFFGNTLFYKIRPKIRVFSRIPLYKRSREHLENTFVNDNHFYYTTFKIFRVYLGNTQSHPSDFRFTPSGSPFLD